MGRKKSVFTPPPARAVSLNVRITAELKERIDTLKAALQAHDPQLSFNTSHICEDALGAAVRQGEAELARLQREA